MRSANPRPKRTIFEDIERCDRELLNLKLSQQPYAALDCSPLVETCHLQAALAVWDYCQASARLFFDGAPIHPIARRIREAVVSSPEGLSKTQILGLFHGHISPERINLALEQLRSLDLIAPRTAAGRGRPATVWATDETSPHGGLNAHNALNKHKSPRVGGLRWMKRVEYLRSLCDKSPSLMLVAVVCFPPGGSKEPIVP